MKIDEDDVNTVLLNTDVSSDGSLQYAYDNFAAAFSENILEYAFAYAEIPRDQITKKQREAAQSLLKLHEIDRLEQSSTLVFAQKCNTKYAGIDVGLALYLDESTLSKYSDDEYMKDEDIVINSTGTGTLGRIGFYRATDNCAGLPIVPDSHVTVIRAYRSIHAFYLYVFMKANQAELEKKGEGSTNQKELKPITLKEMFVPVPPSSEQERIIAAVTTVFSTITAIEKSLS